MSDGNPGKGGAPTRARILPDDAKSRKNYPVASGCLDYFPDALCAIANLSKVGNDQHNPGQPLHWDRSKSSDEADTMLRHFLQRGTLDKDGVRHTVKMAWRALAVLQKELEAECLTESAKHIIDPKITYFSDADGDLFEFHADRILGRRYAAGARVWFDPAWHASELKGLRQISYSAALLKFPEAFPC